MKPKDAYVRRISAEESREQYIFVTKDAIKFFPPLDQEFTLRTPQGAVAARIVGVFCECVPPAHVHYHLMAPFPSPLAKRSTVRIGRVNVREYTLSF